VRVRMLMGVSDSPLSRKILRNYMVARSGTRPTGKKAGKIGGSFAIVEE